MLTAHGARQAQALPLRLAGVEREPVPIVSPPTAAPPQTCGVAERRRGAARSVAGRPSSATDVTAATNVTTRSPMYTSASGAGGAADRGTIARPRRDDHPSTHVGACALSNA